MNLRRLLMKITNRKPKRGPRRVELTYSDARAVEHGGVPASHWAEDQERPR